MADMNDIVQLAVDTYHGDVQDYSLKQSNDLLREAMIKANNNSDKIDYRAIRDGKCGETFSIVEQILNNTVYEGLLEDDFFMNLVDSRNLAEGDQNKFVVEDSTLFVVSDMADGTQGIRRQRLGGRSEVTIPTFRKGVKFYEELNRILAGRVTLSDMINNVSKSMRRKLLNDLYNVWKNATATDFGGNTYFPVAGTYDEGALLDVIAHVEAAAGGKPATIYGTKKAVRVLAPSIQGESSKEDLYTMGYYGNFYGSHVVVTPQRHVPGTNNFVMDDKTLTIVAGDDKPIKLVREGDPLIIPGNPYDNADLTQEYLYSEKYGIGIVLAGGNAGIGRYQYT